MFNQVINLNYCLSECVTKYLLILFNGDLVLVFLKDWTNSRLDDDLVFFLISRRKSDSGYILDLQFVLKRALYLMVASQYRSCLLNTKCTECNVYTC